MKPIRKCNVCSLECYDVSLLDGLFARAKDCKYGYRNKCLTCKYKENNSHPKHKDWKTHHQIKKRYGIDPETYKQHMSSSDKCEICGSKHELCYDHDHVTMEFRGVLCRMCNVAIGQLGDTLEALKKAVNYLERKHIDESEVKAMHHGDVTHG